MGARPAIASVPKPACARRQRQHNRAMTAADPYRPQDDLDGPSYVYKPSLFGAPNRLLLRQDGLQWQIGNYQGLIPYRDVRRVRMSYRPSTMQSRRFVTEIWSDRNPKIQIPSASWRSAVDQDRADTSYTSFVVELHRRLAAANTSVQFFTGMPAVSYWIGAVAFGAALLALIVLVLHALWIGEWAGAAVMGVLCAVFAFQFGDYFLRNRPGRYRPDSLPSNVLPRARLF
jgi:hypothetical protein